MGICFGVYGRIYADISAVEERLKPSRGIKDLLSQKL
jgi:hypothetical protein